MVRKNLGLESEKSRQTTLLDFLFLNNTVCPSNSPKPQFRQTTLTDFVSTKTPSNTFIINHTAHNNQCIVENQEKVMSGDLVSDCRFPMSMKTDFPDSEELIELNQDFALKMLEICIGKLIEEKKQLKSEKRATKPTKQLKLTVFLIENEIENEIEIELKNFFYEMLFYNIILKYYYNKILNNYIFLQNPPLEPSEYLFRSKY